MPTYESIKYKFSGTAITGVMQESENLNDVANKGCKKRIRRAWHVQRKRNRLI